MWWKLYNSIYQRKMIIIIINDNLEISCDDSDRENSNEEASD